MKVAFWLCLFLFSTSLSSCLNNDLAVTVATGPRSKLSQNWSLKLPSHGLITVQKDSILPNVIHFDGDSMILRFAVSYQSKDDANVSFETTLKAVKEKKEVGICLGWYDGDYEFFPFLDTVAKLSGLIANFDDHGKRSVAIRIEDLNSAKVIDISFERLTNQKIRVVHAIIKSVKFDP